jgi:hypothetical protein
VFVRGATAGVGGTLTAAPEALAGGWRAQLEPRYNKAGAVGFQWSIGSPLQREGNRRQTLRNP